MPVHLIVTLGLALVNLLSPLLVNKTVKETDVGNAVATIMAGTGLGVHHRRKMKK